MASLLALGFLAGCASEEEIPVKDISLTTSMLQLKASETGKLGVIFFPANATNKAVTWTSDDESVGTVDENGVVYAVKDGTTTIRATTEDGERTAECVLVVGDGKSTIHVEHVSIAMCSTLGEMSLAVGETGTLRLTFEPDNTTNKEVSWTSSNETVARVNSDTGTVVAQNPGETTIVATTQDGGKTAECSVKVFSRLLSVEMSALPNGTMLTPLETVNHSERSTTFTVEVSGVDNNVDASNVELSISPVTGLSFQTASSTQEGMKTFSVTVHYNGTTAFPTGSAAVQLSLTNIPGDYEGGGPQTIDIPISDGQAKTRFIPLNQANIAAFNNFTHTANGLKLHYRLTGKVTLTGQSNWTAIGTYSNQFTGSFDGGGFSISGLNIHLPNNDYQGLFGVIGADAIVENIGLVGGSVSGRFYVGGVVGSNYGTLQNSYATGNVSGYAHLGGVVGNTPSGTVQNCVALNSSVTAEAEGDFIIGRVAGRIWSGGAEFAILKNNYARSNMVLTSGNGSVTPISGPDQQHGQSTLEYNNDSFWTTTMGWSFPDVWQRGPNNLPILKDVGGAQNPSVK